MADGQDSYLSLQGKHPKGVGSPEWFAAFPGGASGVATPLPPDVNLGNGYIPPSTGRGAPNTAILGKEGNHDHN
jgi:hypothetical protein